MMQDDDEFDVFGECLKKDVNRRRLKRIIQRAILDVAEDDEATPTPNSDRSYVSTPMQRVAQSTRALQKVVTALPDACSRMIFLGRMRKLLAK